MDTIEEPKLMLESEISQDQEENFHNELDEMNQSEVSDTKTWITCPYCKYKQAETEKCGKCGIVFTKFQDEFHQNDDKKKKLGIPANEEKTTLALKVLTVLIFILISILFGWSYYFFVYQKPWRKAEIESITVTSIETGDINDEQQLRIKSKKETISALKRALKSSQKNSIKKISGQTTEKFSLKNIPLPLLKQYQGKYVWVTCENGAVHQGTLYAVYSEQIVLTKPRFNLTIPINRSMIKMVEYDYSDKDYDKDAIEAYQKYKRRTEEALQVISLNSLESYFGKNIRVYLNSGQMHEGTLTKFSSKKITIENIVYGQMITLVIPKENIDRILY
ncbi:hypothetical protein MHK_002985 [Candidatus Magnetomorum sp. HK-1]|nr:hypothetical protein MHK_002985 [Candidatus Magnetomorum sp. HK-1]